MRAPAAVLGDQRWETLLARACWATLAAGVASVLAGGDVLAVLVRTVAPDRRQLFDLMAPAFLLLIAVRMALAAARGTARRQALVLLFVAIVLWGSVSVLSQILYGTPQPLRSPSPLDALSLAGSVCLGGQLVVDRRAARDLRRDAWLGTAIVSALPVALSAALFAVPLPGLMRHVPANVVVQAGLAVLVTVQLVRRQRSLTVTGWRLLTALTLMSVSDLWLRHLVNGGVTRYPLAPDLMWGVAILLLAGAGLAVDPPRTPVAEPGERREDLFVLAAAIGSTLVLAFLPGGTARTIAVGPALIAACATVVRMTMALRQARHAAAEVARSLVDDLTQLPNRRAVLAELASRRAAGQAVGVLVLDLRRFADINESLGHDAGDEVLRRIGSRLRQELGRGALVARLEADQFCVVLPAADPEALTRAGRLARAIAVRPVTVSGLSLTPDCAVGLTGGTEEPAETLRRAQIALSHGKGVREITIYSPGLDTSSRERLQLAEELRAALARDQLHLYYQPQASVSDGTVVSVEALIRWRHPDRGWVQPGEFLDAARRVGLMPAVTENVIRLACRQAARWQEDGRPLRIAVNVGAAELVDGTTMDLLLEMIAAEGLDPHAIVVEVTEESFLVDPDRAQATIRRLDAAGVEVAVDDYGTGFSSLSYLRHLPLAELKIDRAFVDGVDTDDRSRTIVAATTALAHALGMRVVAEGVETAGVMEVLRLLDVDVAQGYHLARPMPAAELDAWLAARPATSADPQVRGQGDREHQLQGDAGGEQHRGHGSPAAAGGEQGQGEVAGEPHQRIAGG